MTVAVVHADTPEGRIALQAAVREAADRQQSLVVLHPLDEPDEVEGVRAQVSEVAGTDGWELLAAVHDGDPVGTTVELLARSGAERVVIGSRGRTATGKFLVERAVQRLITESSVPVLVIKAG
ncbi:MULTISPECIES: universal stress protein [Rhodococcus]|uniref:Universal stress protein n=2 Tax=Rhodococcus pyridinivorans TaxID=103816 RepID=V9X8F7_9NOCA|nr:MULTISPECIES: universal stress protein [Rhodococcus]AHD19721.1 universal stress protein [Rhodococcus pyridinivorans SB3094]AWZ25078.1 universal stress protein [Rhodococcus pyridinivorans]MCT7289675.1 universal stress protein [Rhodococcus sp. PAE-6]OBA37247.1 universal stress protein [Rhodococcus sp. 852002-51564_SCH6189132-a]QOW00805.1 universal stress protein [Rhodococcus pyridinivorans]